MLPETAGALMTAGPMVAKYPMAAGKLAMGAMNGGADAAMGAERAATVWHGSPHKFDRFDSSKIGTGEGAQAYGPGLYLAENPAVAKDYAEKLASAGLAKHALAQNAGQADAAIAAAEQSVKSYQALIANGGGGDARRAQGMLALAQKKLADLQSMKAGTLDEAGSLYKVDLPDPVIARMLDWDKPLSQQAPGVQQAVMATKKQLTPDDIENLGGAAAVRALYDPANKIDNFLGTWESLRGKRDAGETLLRQQGIPGIRYLDGGSRGAGAGSSNFVVFPGEENALQILERNGQKLR
jgi:hypothetical protein